jgi:hypothetical protein
MAVGRKHAFDVMHVMGGGHVRINARVVQRFGSDSGRLHDDSRLAASIPSGETFGTPTVTPHRAGVPTSRKPRRRDLSGYQQGVAGVVAVWLSMIASDQGASGLLAGGVAVATFLAVAELFVRLPPR